MNLVLERIEQNPIIAAVRKENELEQALRSEVQTVFLLAADIFNIKRLVTKIQERQRSALIHLDFLEGLGRDLKAIDYIKEEINPDGIISTKTNSIRYAKEVGLFAIQRFFLIDSLSYETTVKTVHSVLPDMIEIMPGIMPNIIERMTREVSIPVIAGGLITSKQEILMILGAGAIGASTAKKELWQM